MSKIDNNQRLLGRYYDPKTDMWEFSDESGVAIPNEVMNDFLFYAHESRGMIGSTLMALGILFSFKDKFITNQNNMKNIEQIEYEITHGLPPKGKPTEN